MKKKVASLLLVFVMVVLAACSKKDNDNANDSVKEIALADIHTKVKEVYGENYLPNMPFDDTALQNVVGLDPALCEEYIAETPMISTNVDTFIAVRAKSGKVEEVKTVLDAYRTKLVEDTVQYPMNQIKVQASRVVSYGDYVFFLMLGFIDPEVETKEEDVVLKAYEAENQKAVDAIEGLLK